MKIFPTLPICTLVAAAGCTVGPNYTAPQPKLEETFSSVQDTPSETSSKIVAGQEAVTRWWFVFNDPELNSLIERMRTGNFDLQEAVSRVRLARAQRIGITAGIWPTIDASAGYNRGHGSENVVLPFGGGGNGATSSSSSSTQPSGREVSSESDSSASRSSSGNASSGGAPLSPLGQGGLPGATTNLYQVGFDASWEIDIFGGTRRAIEAANAGVAAAEEGRRALLVSTLAEIANTYIELRTTQQRLQIARANLGAQQDELRIIQAKFKTGFATDLEVAQQSAQVSATASAIPALETAQRKGYHALAFMIGAAPEALVAELALPSSALPLPAAVPVGVPSDLLRRRPDIRRAERELALANAQIGIATADLWPKFSLTGAFGFDSSSASNVLDWPSHYYSISPGIHWPILDWGRIRANVRIENERQQQAFTDYQKSVAQALKDVEDGLVQYENEQARHIQLTDSVDHSRRARELAQQRYAHGVTDLLATIEAQRSLLQSEDALAQSDGALRQDLVTLYKALGGGWEL